MKVRVLILLSISLSFAGCITGPGGDSTDDVQAELCLHDRIVQSGKLAFHSDTDEWIRLKSQMVEFGYIGTNAIIMTLSHISHAKNGKRCEYVRTEGGRSGRYYIKEIDGGDVELGRIDDNNSFIPIRFYYDVKMQ